MNIGKRTFEEKFTNQHGRCYYCGEDLYSSKIEVDHIRPFSKYKDGRTVNLCLACYDCNRLKSDLDMIEFKLLVLRSYPYKLIRGFFYFEFIRL